MLLHYICTLIKSDLFSHYLTISKKDNYFYYISQIRDPHWGTEVFRGFETQPLTWWVCGLACRLYNSLDAQNDALKSGKHPGPLCHLRERTLSGGASLCSRSAQGAKSETALSVSVKSITNDDESGLVSVFDKNNACFIKTSFWHSHIQTKPTQQHHEVNEADKRGLLLAELSSSSL